MFLRGVSNSDNSFQLKRRGIQNTRFFWGEGGGNVEDRGTNITPQYLSDVGSKIAVSGGNLFLDPIFAEVHFDNNGRAEYFPRILP